MPFQVVLTTAAAAGGTGGHIAAGLCSVGAGQARALAIRDVSPPVELRRRLAEVPDVPRAVLRVPVRRPLLEPALDIEVVVHRRRLDAFDHAGRAADRDDVTRRLAVLDAAVDVDRSG